MKKVLLITALVFGLGVAGFAVPSVGHPDYLWVVYPPTHVPGLDVNITMPFYSAELAINIDFVVGFEDIAFTVPKFPLRIPRLTLNLTKVAREANKTDSTVHIMVLGPGLAGRHLICRILLSDAAETRGEHETISPENF